MLAVEAVERSATSFQPDISSEFERSVTSLETARLERYRPVLPWSEEYAGYNGIRVPLGRGKELLLAREVLVDSVEEDKPDIGRLGQWISHGNKVKFVGYLEAEHSRMVSAEDTRKKYLGGSFWELDITAIGLDNRPSAGMIIGRATENGFEDLKTVVFGNDIGKNFTPFFDRHLFRRDPEELDTAGVEDPKEIEEILKRNLREKTSRNHTLDLVEVVINPRPHLETIQEIYFEPNFWTSVKVGTQGAPILLSDGAILLPIHGVRIEKGKYIYSLGFALLNKVEGEYKVFRISPYPFYERRMLDMVFPRNEKPTDTELHPQFRNALYSVDNTLIPTSNGLYLATEVSAGDRIWVQTVDPLTRILSDLRRPEFAKIA